MIGSCFTNARGAAHGKEDCFGLAERWARRFHAEELSLKRARVAHEQHGLQSTHQVEEAIDSMIAVVHGERGTARAIGLNSPWTIAGKTGTAQVVGIAQGEEYDEEDEYEDEEEDAGGVDEDDDDDLSIIRCPLNRGRSTSPQPLIPSSRTMSFGSW